MAETVKHRETEVGQFYVYRDEDGNAVAIAMMAKGPNGGRAGIDYARMGVPYGTTTREDINDRADFMVSAMNTFGNTRVALAAKDAEIELLRSSLSVTLSSLERWYRNGSPEFDGSAHPTSVIGTARGLVGLDPATGMPADGASPKETTDA